MAGLVDSHAHLQAAAFDGDRPEALARARAAGVELIVLPSTDAQSCRDALAPARGGWPVAPSAGLHPNGLGQVAADEWAQIAKLAREPEIVAVGETGLDYYRERASAAEQRASFVRHLALAAELGRPVPKDGRRIAEALLASLKPR